MNNNSAAHRSFAHSSCSTGNTLIPDKQLTDFELIEIGEKPKAA